MRRILAACSVAAIVTLQFGAGSVFADAPANDNLETPEVIANLFGFEATPDMSEATMQDGEPTCVDTEGQVMTHSVWYTWTAAQPAMIAINIYGPDHEVTAGVFGPFDTLPTSVSDLPVSRPCIYDTGPDSGLTDYYAPAGKSWLIQLTTVEGFVTPMLVVDQWSPSNNDVAYPQPISYPVYEDSPPMDWTSLEDGEPVCADVEDQDLNQSIWYRMDFDFPTDMGIEINGEPEHSVTAGVYGPFDVLPTSVAGLEARSCIYGTGADSALHERYAPGSYLVQLTRHWQDSGRPSILFTEEMVTVAPWQASTAVTVPEGVPIDFAWGWFACSQGLAKQAPDALMQTYVMRQGDDELFSLSAEDSHVLWSGPEPSDSLVDTCRPTASMGAEMRWSWFVDNLTAGEYQLDVLIMTVRQFTDGTASDGGGVMRYPVGTIFGFGTIDITVTEP